MRILIVTKYYHPVIGGVETLVRTLAERYVAAGHQCTVLCMDPEKDSDDVLHGVRVVRFRRSGISRTGLVPGMWRWLVENNVKDGFDIVNVNNYHIPLALEAAFFCHTRGIHFVLTSHYHGRGHTPQRNLLFQLYGLVAKEMMAWSERVICVSEYERSLVVRDFPFVKDKITIVPNGGKDLPSIRVDRQRDRVLFVGRLMKYKGVDHLLRAIGLLSAKGVHVSLHIVGSGPEKEALKALASELGVADRVEWLEGLNEEQLQAEYLSAAVFVLLSSAEAYGLVVAEALNSGTPCIVAKTSALTEFASEPGCFGVDYPPNIQEVADYIEKAMNGGVKVGPFSDKLITWDQVTSRYLGIYQEVLSSHHAEGRPPQLQM